MDPWSSRAAAAAADLPVSCTPADEQTALPLAFENSFSNSGNPRLPNGGASCERLPDSLEYIARLEAKLGSLRAGTCRQQQQSKEAAIARLLRADSRQLLHGLGGQEEDLALEEAVETSLLLRHISPEQPLTRGETVTLVTADQLDQLRQQLEQQLEEESNHQQQHHQEENNHHQQL